MCPWPGGGARDAVGSGIFSKFPADNASKSLQKSRAARARDNHTLSYLVLLMYQLTINFVVDVVVQTIIPVEDCCQSVARPLRPLVTTVATGYDRYDR